jgi:hypothetical protein
MWWDRTNMMEFYRLWTVMLTPPLMRSSTWMSTDTKADKEKEIESDEISHVAMHQNEKKVLERLINNQIILLEQIDSLKKELESHTKELRRAKDS